MKFSRDTVGACVRAFVLLTVSQGAAAAAPATASWDDTEIHIHAEVAATGASQGKTVTPGQKASLDAEISTSVSDFRLRVNTGVDTYEIVDGGLQYANMVLQPDIRGFSVAADGAYHWSPNSRHHLNAIGNLRVSPTTVWTVNVPRIDPMTGMAQVDPSTMMVINDKLSDSVVVLGFEVGLGYLYSIKNDENSVQLEADANFSLRAITGDAKADVPLLLATIGTDRTLFLGASIKIKLTINDISAFVEMPMLYSVPSGGDIRGLTGPRVVFGAEQKGDFIVLKKGSAQADPHLMPHF